MDGRKVKIDLLFDKISFEIVGSAFEVQNELGSGLLEKTYYKALAQEFTKRGIKFEQQVYFPIKYKGEVVGKRYFDFLVEEKIIVELKCEKNFSRSTIKQVFDYLVSSNLQLVKISNSIPPLCSNLKTSYTSSWPSAPSGSPPSCAGSFGKSP